MIQQQPILKQIDDPAKQKIREHYDRVANRRAPFRVRNRYYYQELIKYLKFIVPSGKSVLEIGCADGYLLEHLEPSRGIGIDISPAMVEAARARADRRHLDHLEFHQADIEACRCTEQVDFVLMSDVLGTLLDIQRALDNLRSACRDDTRIIIHYHSILWEPILNVCERIGLKMSQPHHNWLSPSDINNFLTLGDFELIRFDRRVLLPRYIPILSTWMNRYVALLPLLNKLCLTNLLVIRKKARQSESRYSTTIVIPCRNERGNIRPAIERIPRFGEGQEIIFVDGHSTDGSCEEIEAIIRESSDKEIRLLIQPGQGKGDAVRYAFAHAKNDVLMILDADLTVPPEDLPKFYHAIASRKGEFINGTRLVYPMEREAMRMLNILGNKFFSVALSWLLNQPLKDTLCGTKVLLLRDYQAIARGRNYFGDFDPFGDFDLIFGAAKLNMKILEVPIRYRERTYGSTNISRFRHGWLLLKMTLFAFRKLKTIR